MNPLQFSLQVIFVMDSHSGQNPFYPKTLHTTYVNIWGPFLLGCLIFMGLQAPLLDSPQSASIYSAKFFADQRW
jgi:hypothetical protein